MKEYVNYSISYIYMKSYSNLYDYLGVVCFILIIYPMTIYYNYCCTQKGYLWYLPVSDDYPNSFDELPIIYNKIINRTKKEEEFYYLTDYSISNVFAKILKNHSIDEMDELCMKPVDEILRLKRYHNRIRPYQLFSKNVNVLKTETGHTPAYPAGHAYQAWYLYRYYSKMYPELKETLYKLAERCDNVRVAAGIHYPSDGQYSKRLVFTLEM